MSDKSEKDSCNIKYVKLKLHLKYVIAICIIITMFTVVAATVTNDKFVDQISFASTITSIILSVIAIIVTLIGEMKSENTKDKLVSVSDNLSKFSETIESATDKLQDISDVNIKINKLDDIINRIDNVNNKVSETNSKMESLFLNDRNDDNLEGNQIEINYIEIYKEITATNDDEKNNSKKYAHKMICNIVYYYKRYLEQFDEVPEMNYVKEAAKKVDKGIGSAFYVLWGMSFLFFMGINRKNQEFGELIIAEMEKDFKNYKSIIDQHINTVDKERYKSS